MKKAALLSVIAGVAVGLLTVVTAGGGTASADGGPHVATGSNATPDKCAACHRIHTGQNEYLLKEASTVMEFCYSCHGTGGAGSDLAVQEGTFYGVDPPGPAPYGDEPASTSVGLRSGGFDMARINTTDPGFESIGVLATPQAATSWHTNDGTTLGTIWGNGGLGTGAGPSFAMECTSCHDPHGNGQYRILRPVPLGSNASVGVNVTDQAAPKVYTTTNYFSTGPVSGLQISSWCATCHTRYLASSTAASGDPIFANRHRSNGTLGTACIKCHAAHGTNAGATGEYSSTVGFPGGGTGTTATAQSKLLKMDNRGICIKCHTDYPSPSPTVPPIHRHTRSTSTPASTATVTPTAAATLPPTVTPTETPAPTVTPATETPTVTGVERLWGDGDCDGEISSRDDQALLRKVLEQSPLSQTEPCPDLGATVDGRTWGDWDCDGAISSRDRALLRAVLQQNALSQTEPCPNIGQP